MNKYYEWHSPSTTVKELKEPTCPTLVAAMGMGGANMTTPILIVSIREREYLKENAKNYNKSGE